MRRAVKENRCIKKRSKRKTKFTRGERKRIRKKAKNDKFCIFTHPPKPAVRRKRKRQKPKTRRSKTQEATRKSRNSRINKKRKRLLIIRGSIKLQLSHSELTDYSTQIKTHSEIKAINTIHTANQTEHSCKTY